MCVNGNSFSFTQLECDISDDDVVGLRVKFKFSLRDFLRASSFHEIVSLGLRFTKACALFLNYFFFKLLIFKINFKK